MSIDATVGDTLTCNAPCNPSCNYVWTEPNGNNFTSQTVTLSINGTNLYTCTAWNVYGSASRQIIVNTSYPPTTTGSNNVLLILYSSSNFKYYSFSNFLLGQTYFVPIIIMLHALVLMLLN